MDGGTPDIKSKGKKKNVKKGKKTKEVVEGETVNMKKKLKKGLLDGLGKKLKKEGSKKATGLASPEPGIGKYHEKDPVQANRNKLISNATI